MVQIPCLIQSSCLFKQRRMALRWPPVWMYGLCVVFYGHIYIHISITQGLHRHHHTYKSDFPRARYFNSTTNNNTHHQHQQQQQDHHHHHAQHTLVWDDSLAFSTENEQNVKWLSIKWWMELQHNCCARIGFSFKTKYTRSIEMRVCLQS